MTVESNPSAGSAINRRRFLSMAGGGVALSVLAAGLPSTALGAVRSVVPFYHAHTGEEISLEIGAGGYCTAPDSVRINEFLRDFRTGEVHPIDPQLLETLRLLRLEAGGTGTFEVISGYRSPITNATLRARSSGVAKRSLHMYGMAIDVRLSGISTRGLRNVARRLRRGGVGYYRSSRFIHIDTGRVRNW